MIVTKNSSAKIQTNTNDRNSKFQTKDSTTNVPYGITTRRPGFALRFNCGECFGHWILKFEIYLAQF